MIQQKRTNVLEVYAVVLVDDFSLFVFLIGKMNVGTPCLVSVCMAS